MDNFTRNTPASDPANSPITNPLKSNNNKNPNDSYNPGELPEESNSDMSRSEQSTDDRSQEEKYAKALRQILSQFFIKGALTVASCRVPGTKRVTKAGNPRENSWFNLILQDINQISQDTQGWREVNIEDGLPPPLTVEIYLNLKDLTKTQSLVIQDERGRSWNVADALQPSSPFAPSTSPKPYARRPDRVVLERWRFALEEQPDAQKAHTRKIILPDVYKKAVPLFRTFFTVATTNPVHKYFKSISKRNSNGLKLKLRILNTLASTSSNDSLACPLYYRQTDIVQSYDFASLPTPVGDLTASVIYRCNCDFRVDDSESMLSSHFKAMDDPLFRPSFAFLDNNHVATGSAPTSSNYYNQPFSNQAYASSSSTFLQNLGRLSSSPLTGLSSRTTAKEGIVMTSDGKQQKTLPSNSGRPTENPVFNRRHSTSVQPFKAGTLASSSSPSPSPLLAHPPSPGRPLNVILPHRQIPSSNTLPQAILRTPAVENDNAIASSTSTSPRPAPLNQRYSSSFSNRRPRFSSASKGDEESSGKPSPTSSARDTNSDILNDITRTDALANSGSIQKSDDENVRDFLFLLESKKDLRGLNAPDAESQQASIRKNTAALAQLQQLKKTSLEFSETLFSASSSRQISNVPSTGFVSSTAKTSSPHTNTPAVPSRLSSVNYLSPRRSRSRSSPVQEASEPVDLNLDLDTITPMPLAVARPPRPWTYGRRVSSDQTRNDQSPPPGKESADPSVAHQQSASASTNVDDGLSLESESIYLSDDNTAMSNQQTMQKTRRPKSKSTQFTMSNSQEQISSSASSSQKEHRSPPSPSPQVAYTAATSSLGSSTPKGTQRCISTSTAVTEQRQQEQQPLPNRVVNSGVSRVRSYRMAQKDMEDQEKSDLSSSELLSISSRVKTGSSGASLDQDYDRDENEADGDGDGIFTMSDMGSKKSLEEINTAKARGKKIS